MEAQGKRVSGSRGKQHVNTARSLFSMRITNIMLLLLVQTTVQFIHVLTDKILK
jgi:hypothetical protein